MNDKTPWDPLETISTSDQEILIAAKKREIKNILKSYVGKYDSFAELIQNAMDSIEKRIVLSEQHFEPKIIVHINLKENSVEVVDNGVGFTSEQFRSFLAPSISFKDGSGTRGNKGVGVTYVAYGFNNLIIRTKNDSFHDARRIKNGRIWVDDRDAQHSRPKANPVAEESTWFAKVDQGASFKITFGGANTRPKNLTYYNATTPHQWKYLLLTKTPIGFIDIINQCAAEIKFDIFVTDVAGNLQSEENCETKYKYPHGEIAASRELSNILELQKKAIDNGKDPDLAIKRYTRSNGIYECFKTEDLIVTRTLTDEEKELAELYDVVAYGYFTYSTEIWDKLNDTKAKLRKGLRILKGGLQLANNNMVQGDLITIPLTKSIGHQNQTHVIVHFSDADPDLGRKGFQPELKSLAEKLSVMIVGKLSAQRKILKSDSGAQVDIEKDIKFHEWMKDQEKHAEENPLTLTNDNFFLPTKKISIGAIPRSEQDTIALFNQLLAGGVIRGIRLLATSQVSQYDGVFQFCAEEPLDNHIFNKDKNPLGILTEQLIKPYVAPPKVIEYKFNLDGLIREFESGVKNEKDIDLAVFWEIGGEYKRDYTVTSLLDFENIQHRQHHGLTHLLSSSNTQIQAICLSELFQLLNNPIESQGFQKSEYEDEF